jgi:hypothetical protein
LIKIKSSDALANNRPERHESAARSAEKRAGYAEIAMPCSQDLILINFAGLFSANVFASTVGGCWMKPPKFVPR